jgi:DNA primase
VTLEDLVREVFSDLRERDNSEVYVNCPFCEERGETRDTRQRLGINYELGRWNCFNCHHSGRENPEWLFRELVRVFDLDPTEYRFSYHSQMHKEKVKKKQSLRPVSLPSEFEPLWEKATDRIHKKALKYMLARGITKDQIEEHFVGFCAVGKYAGRIVFPVYRKEEVIGFVTRAFLPDVEPRYLNSEGLKYLWNTPDERVNRGVLIEGVFDALAAERALKKVHPLAGLGSDLTDEQLKPLTKFKRLTIVPDPDRPGIIGAIKRARKLLELKSGIELFVIIPKEGSSDWGASESKQIISAYKEKVRWTKYVESRLRMLAAGM